MNKFEKISKKQYDFDVWGGRHMATYDELKLPHRATKCSAGYDFYATVGFELPPGESIKLPTGIKVALDENKFLMVVPRSSLGFKHRAQLDNTVGIIDSDYYNNQNNEGHIWIKITNDSKRGDTLVINKGDAIAQGIILEYFKTDDDDADGVRNGGLGSTSK